MSRNVTMIAELPDLEDLEPQIQKHIRVHKKPVEIESFHTPQVQQQVQPSHSQQVQQQVQPSHFRNEHVNYDIVQQPEPISPAQYYCIDIARHIQMCPICSKIYHQDKTIYFVIIAVLVLLCLMLLKKILNV